MPPAKRAQQSPCVGAFLPKVLRALRRRLHGIGVAQAHTGRLFRRMKRSGRLHALNISSQASTSRR